MKGPEEKEHHASSCSAEWLVDQSRNAMSNGDLYAAKSWLLTAKTLYPKAFAVQVTHRIVNFQRNYLITYINFGSNQSDENHFHDYCGMKQELHSITI